MKIFVGSLALVIALSGNLLAYDNSPDRHPLIPEVIWAEASGGGTWATEMQITDMTGGSVIRALFFYAGGVRGVYGVWASPGKWCSVKYSNILSTLQSLDPSFAYFGRVGTIWLSTQDFDHKIQAQARTVNGNYGKTFPGLAWVASNFANVGRSMMIMDLANNATYRTAVGFYNSCSDYMTVEFKLIGPNNNLIGSAFTKTFAYQEFKSFNPFAEAGVGSGSYDNVWLLINPTSGGIGGLGLLGFGSTANNYTNDTAAHIAVQFQ